MIDRPIRPLFPKGYYKDVQVVATVMSVDLDNPPEVLAMIGSSAALCISGLPFAGPTGSVAVGMVDGEYIINPNSEQREKSRLNLTVSGTKDAVMMVEARRQRGDRSGNAGCYPIRARGDQADLRIYSEYQG